MPEQSWRPKTLSVASSCQSPASFARTRENRSAKLADVDEPPLCRCGALRFRNRGISSPVRDVDCRIFRFVNRIWSFCNGQAEVYCLQLARAAQKFHGAK